MDAVSQSEPSRSVESLRMEVQQTSEALASNVALLQDSLHRSFGTIQDPFHLSARVRERPFLACGLALLVGGIVSASRAHRVPLRMLGGVGRGVWSTARSTCFSMGIEAVRGLIRSGR